MDKFELGSVVRLNSGSPLMTVEYFREGGEVVDVAWLHEGKIQRGWFKPECLTPTDAEGWSPQ